MILFPWWKTSEIRFHSSNFFYIAFSTFYADFFVFSHIFFVHVVIPKKGERSLYRFLLFAYIWSRMKDWKSERTKKMRIKSGKWISYAEEIGMARKESKHRCWRFFKHNNKTRRQQPNSETNSLFRFILYFCFGFSIPQHRISIVVCIMYIVIYTFSPFSLPLFS